MAKQKEVVEELGKLNEVIFNETRRENGSLRIQQDFSNCPTMTEQHTAHLTDINYLVERYRPDEFAAYLAARSQHRTEILGHDFSKEPSLQDAKNVVYQSRKHFEELPEDVRIQFRSHLEFMKFIDNPDNAEKMVKMGILTKKQIENIQIPDATQIKNTDETKTNDSNDKK